MKKRSQLKENLIIGALSFQKRCIKELISKKKQDRSSKTKKIINLPPTIMRKNQGGAPLHRHRRECSISSPPSHHHLKSVTECNKNGTTTILLTKIPFFREIMITSFYCSHCENRNSKVEFAGKLPDFGVEILFRAMNSEDLGRELIKSEQSVIKFEEIDLEIPQNGKAEINTIEGYLRRTHDQLNFHQPLRRIHEPESYEKLKVFLERVRGYMNGEHFPLTVRVRDPSGNSHVKNPFAPKIDKNLEMSSFERSLEEYEAMISWNWGTGYRTLQGVFTRVERVLEKIQGHFKLNKNKGKPAEEDKKKPLSNMKVENYSQNTMTQKSFIY